MRYIMAAALMAAAYLWFAPASYPFVQPSRDTLRAYSASSIPSTETVRASVDALRQRIRSKAMELLRKELHDSVDSLVK